MDQAIGELNSKNKRLMEIIDKLEIQAKEKDKCLKNLNASLNREENCKSK